jgi:hypothetical protein
MCIRCCGNPFTEQLPSDSLGIVDVFTGHHQAKHVPFCDCCIATAIHATILKWPPTNHYMKLVVIGKKKKRLFKGDEANGLERWQRHFLKLVP